MSTEPGTNCLTKGEDAIAAAWAETDAWQTISKSDDAIEAANSIHIDQVGDPQNGFAFTLDELELRSVLTLVIADPEEGYLISQGEAIGNVIARGRVLMVIEKLISEVERDSGDNQERILKNLLISGAHELFDALNASHGPRWMQSLDISQMPIELYNRRDEKILGRRLQSTFTVEFGPGE